MQNNWISTPKSGISTDVQSGNPFRTASSGARVASKQLLAFYNPGEEQIWRYFIYFYVNTACDTNVKRNLRKGNRHRRGSFGGMRIVANYPIPKLSLSTQ